MKRIIYQIGAFLLVLIVAFGVLPQKTFAAKNECVLVKGSAEDCDVWKEFMLETGKNWGSNKITFKQDKGKLEYNNHGLANTKNLYGAYTIKVDDGNEIKKYYWKYKETYSLKLKDKTTYTIEIKPYQPETVGEQNYKSFSYAKLHKKLGILDMASWSWSDAPTWEVTSTKAVDWCQPLN